MLCLQNMQLEATSEPGGRKAFLVAGTSVNRGEDMSTKGNVSVQDGMGRNVSDT